MQAILAHSGRAASLSRDEALAIARRVQRTPSTAADRTRSVTDLRRLLARRLDVPADDQILINSRGWQLDDAVLARLVDECRTGAAVESSQTSTLASTSTSAAVAGPPCIFVYDR